MARGVTVPKTPPAPYEPTSQEREDLAIVRELVRAGVPVVLGVPHPNQPGEFKPTAGWQRAKPDESVVDRWRPGLALGVVTGVVVDVLDVDPRNGGSTSLDHLRSIDAIPEPVAVVSTASEGAHYWFSPLLIGKKSRAGVDLLSGRLDGSGRAIAWVPPTSKTSKVDGHVRPYRWVQDPDLSRLTKFNGETDTPAGRLAEWISDRNQSERPANTERKPAVGGPGSKGSKPTAYGTRIWERELDRLRRAPEGERNNTLNRVAFSISQIYHGGELGDDPTTYIEQMRAVARDLDLSYAIEPTMASGWEKGALDPRDNSSYAKPKDQQDDEGDVSWDPERSGLSEALAGTSSRATPTVLSRSDGRFLLYPGLVHSIHGESESGKSFIVQWAAAEQIQSGNRVVYVDYESDADTLVGRLEALGCTRSQVRQFLLYVRPEHPPGGEHFLNLIAKAAATPGATLVVVDGVTEAMVVSGVNLKDNNEVTSWVRSLPRKLAGSGAAVVVVDHVIKSGDDRGRFAIGAQAKMAALDGAAYTVEVLEPMGVGLMGKLALRVAKDRPGRIRPYCGQWDEYRTQLAATVYFDGRVLGGPGGKSKTSDQIKVLVDAPNDADEVDKSGAADREQRYTDLVIDYLEHWPLSTKTEIERSIQGDNNKIRKALQSLMDQGYVLRSRPAGASHAIRCELNPDKPWKG